MFQFGQIIANRRVNGRGVLALAKEDSTLMRILGLLKTSLNGNVVILKEKISDDEAKKLQGQGKQLIAVAYGDVSDEY